MKDPQTIHAAEGCLFVVAVPLGHPDDITARAVDTLRQVDLILAEDTRITAGLLHQFHISKPLEAFHDHNEAQRLPALLARLQSGAQVALVSDAGTPLISDPGFRLVRAAHEVGCRVSPLPGPCAAMAALSVAGLATDRFFFEGFLPAKSAARQARLVALRPRAETLVFYEAPHRIAATLADCVAVLGGDRLATLARELTKTYETIKRLPLSSLRDWVEADANQQRGEMVLMISGASEAEAQRGRWLTPEAVLDALGDRLPPGETAALVAQLMGLRRNEVYARLRPSTPRDDFS